jgi:8-oxo-dGTP pyrophosphatase MutT (NUDIX family)
MTNDFWGQKASGVLPICTSTGRILIGKRSKDVKEPFTWGNFGGAIGLDDEGNPEEELSPYENAKKELFEETGFSGEISLLRSYIFKNTGFVYYNYIGLVSQEFQPIINWEISEAKWVTLNDLLVMEDLHFGLSYLLMYAYDQIYFSCFNTAIGIVRPII